MNYFKLKFLLLFFALAVAIPPAWAETVYELLTSNDQLKAGKTLIITSKRNSSGTADAMYQQQSNNFSATTVSIKSDQTIVDTGEAQILTLEGATDAWHFKTIDNLYLYAASSSKNYLRSKAEIDPNGNSNAKIIINSTTGVSQIIFQGDYTHKRLKHNTQGIFSCYENGQEDVYIYIEKEGGDTPPAEENIYQKVTNASQLVAGKTYIIVNESADVGMGAVDDNRYGTVVTGLEFADGKVNIGGTEVMELTLGGKEYAWTFMLPDNQHYLAKKGNDDDRFLLATSPTTNISKWTIDLSNGCSIINNDNSNEDYRYIRYENNRFDISYGSNVALYVKYEGGETPQPADVTLSFPQESYTATLGQAFTAPTLSVDPADAASEVTYSSSKTDVATVANDGTVTLVGAGTTTITASINDSETYKNASASYILTVSPDLSNTAVLDFNEANYWTPNLPTGDKLVDERSFTDGAGYTVKIAGSTGNGYYWTSHYLLLGKQGAYIQLPAFNRAVKSIVVEVPGTASASVKQNIFVGETAVSTETTGNGNHTYNISSEYQRAGTIYTLKVNSAHNTQIKRILINFDENASVVPLISVTPSSVTITDATGDDKTGTISATVDPAGTVNATATEGWSATNSSVTYQGKALHAEGTATFSSTGATDVEASLEYNYTGPLYILGTVNNGGWAPNNYVAMTRGADGLYTVRVTTNAGKEGLSWISFTKRVANDADDGAWNYIRPYRFVPYSENGDAWWLTDGTVNQFNTLDFNTDHVDDQPVRMSPGTYDITINANDNTFKIEPYIVTVETPTFNPEAGSYKTFQSVTISCATEGATIHYTVDGSEPTESSPVYGDPISVKSKTTIKAIAMKSGMANSAIAEATYNLPQTVATMAEAMGVVANSYFLFTGDAVVTYAGQSNINSNYHYIFIRDKRAENGGGVIFYSTNNNVTVPSVQATNVLKRGWYAQLRPYNSWKEFQKAEFVEASGETAADDAAPFDRTGMELKYDDNVNEYVKIDNVTYNEGNITYAGQNREDVTYTYKVVNHFNVSLEDGKHYNIEGVVTRNNNTIEFYPTAATLAKQDLELAFEPTAANAYVGENVTEPALKGLPEGLAVTYSSSNTEVATVDANTGEVTAVAAGEAVITATFAGNDEYAKAEASYTLTVKAKENVTLTFDKENVELYAGQEFTAPTLSGLPEGATVTYTVTNTDPEVEVAKVENNVVVLTGNAGTATVTATYAGDASHNSATASYTITVKAKEPAGLKFVIQKVEGQQDNIYQYFSIGKDPVKPTLENPNDLPVNYSVLSPEGIISIDAETGKVTLLGKSGTGSIVAETTGDETHAAGKVYLSFNVRPEVATYKLVTDASKLKADDKFIIVGTNQSGTFGMDMLSYGSNSNPVLGSQKVVIADNKIETNLPEVFTLKAVGSESANWYMQENTYGSQSLTNLTARGDNGLYFQNPGQNSEMSISIASDGKATIQFPNVDAESAKYLRMTKYTDARFGRYETADGSVPIYIYKQVIQEEPTLAFAEETPAKAYVGDELTLTVNNVPEGATLTFTSNPADAVEFDDNGKVTFLKAGEVKITANTTETDEFLPGTVTYTITVENKPLTITLDPASGEYTVGKEAKVKVTIENVVGESDVEYVASYTVNDEVKKQKLTANEGYVTLPNDKAVTYTLTVTALDERMEEVTATGTYKFNAAPAFDITLTPNKEGNYTVGENAVVTVAVDKYIDEDYLVTYTIGDSEEQIEYDAETGIVLPNDKAGDVTVKVYVTDGYDHEGEGTATATYHFDAAPAIVVTLTPAEGSYTVGTEVKVNVKIENTIGDYLATYTINDGEEQEFDGNDIVIPSDQIATVTLAVSVTDAYHDGVTTVTGQYVFSPMPVVAMPTFSLVAGSYTDPQTVIINCATEGATISYSTDGGQTWTKGNTVYVDKDMTIMAKASKDGYTISETATGYYVIDIPEALPTDMPTFDGYYSVLNSGKYANIQGRKTLTFTDAPDAQAGTVIRLKSDNTGKVEVLRSQAADLQRYAYRAMDYVPDIVQIVVDKLGAEGEGHILGKDGLDAIMTKFDESFKPDLYIEKAGDNGYRIYGRTPSMQPVVDFYRENKDKVEAKLPDLVAFINSALAKLRNKANQAGMDGDNVFVDFDLKTIWTRMGGNLTDPEVDEMGFYRDVLNYKDNVWNFAYQTATFYLEKIKNTGTYTSLSEQLGEFAQYLDKIDQIHPDFKYYIVANEEVTKPDFISQGNADIINNAARTIWTIKERPNFTVNFPAENKYGNEYVTTLYTDFAYTLPKGVTAWAVTSVSDQGIGELTAIDGTTIAAQTPVLLKSTTAGDVATFGITTADGTAAPEGNLLVGPDYLINTYKLTTPQVEGIFNMIKEKLGEDFYNTYVKEYEHLMYLNSGTVNNKYFWGLKEEDVKKCTYLDEEGVKDYVVRGLEGNAFVNNKQVKTNKAFLVSETDQTIKLSLRGDINKDGVISIIDVTALIDILLDLPAKTYQDPTDTYPKGLDYEAADVNEEKGIEITDVTTLIDILLNMPDQPAQGSGN